jgi:hypothetical protein
MEIQGGEDGIWDQEFGVYQGMKYPPKGGERIKKFSW